MKKQWTQLPEVGQRFRHILEDVGSQLQARNDGALYTPQIWQLQRDLEYVKDQIEVAQARRSEVLGDVAFLEPEVAQLEERNTAIREQKAALAAQLEALDQSLAGMGAGLQALEEESARLEKGHGELLELLREKEAFLDDVRRRESEYEPLAASLQAKASRLEDELQVAASTRDIIAGLVPAQLDQGVVQGIQQEMQARLDVYMGDMREDIDRIERSLSGLTAQWDALGQEKDRLALRRQELAEEALPLGAVPSDRSAEALEQEILAAQNVSAQLAAQRDEARDALAGLDGGLDALDAALAGREAEALAARQRQAALDQRLADLLQGAGYEQALAAFEAQRQAQAEKTRCNAIVLGQGEALLKRLAQLRDETVGERDALGRIIVEFETCSAQLLSVNPADRPAA